MLVIKIGGGAAIGNEAFASFAADIATITEPVVVVHGGNAEFSRLCEALGMPPQITCRPAGFRATDAETMDAMLMAAGRSTSASLPPSVTPASTVGLSARTAASPPVTASPCCAARSRAERSPRRPAHHRRHRPDAIRPMDAGFVTSSPCPRSTRTRACRSMSTETSSPRSSPKARGRRAALFLRHAGLLADRHDESTLVRDRRRRSRRFAAAEGGYREGRAGSRRSSAASGRSRRCPRRAAGVARAGGRGTALRRQRSRHEPAGPAVCFDVGETLFDETRFWAEVAVCRRAEFTLAGTLGGLIERRESHRSIFGYPRPSRSIRS